MPSKEEYLQAADLADRAAKRLERGWNRGAFAEDSGGKGCDPSNPEACSWCIAGAVAAETNWLPPYEAIMETASDVVGRHAIAWNELEAHSQTEVVKAMRDTASVLRRKAEEIANEACQGV